jgi:hypothetical protein
MPQLAVRLKSIPPPCASRPMPSSSVWQAQLLPAPLLDARAWDGLLAEGDDDEAEDEGKR